MRCTLTNTYIKYSSSLCISKSKPNNFPILNIILIFLHHIKLTLLPCILKFTLFCNVSNFITIIRICICIPLLVSTAICCLHFAI